MMDIFGVLMLPFLGTCLGAMGVFVPGNRQSRMAERSLTGFAAGVMTAASVWSLILPAIEQSAHLGAWQFLPAAVGVWLGFGFLLMIDHLLPHLHRGAEPEGLPAHLENSTMLTLAVALHNLPEGMAVGVAAAGYLLGDGSVGFAGLLTLSLGITLQNIPEGAIISMPLHSSGTGRGKSFVFGVLSGIVEPIGALVTLAAAWLIVPVLPCLLCFAAGAMLYVVVEALIPDMARGEHSDWGVMAFCIGFTVMMALDVALG